MRELQGRRRARRLFYSKTTIFVLLVILVILARSAWGMYEKNQLASYHREKSEEELLELKNRVENLSANVSRLKTDRGVEEEIRKNFSVSKDGEYVITVIDPANLNDETAKENNQPNRFWHKISDILIN